MRVLIFHPDGSRYRPMVEGRLTDVAVDTADDEADFRRRLPDAEVLLTFRFPVDALACADRLRWIQVTSAGTEFLIPAADRLRDVVVTNGRGIHAAPIADYVMTAAVMLHSDFPGFVHAQSARRWERRPVQALAGKTIGIIGLGSIGQEIARRAVASGMDVIGVRRSGTPVEGVRRVFAPADLHAFLRQCDFVALTVPMTDATRAMIEEDALAQMKPSAYLINVSRGSVVDERALTRALDEGRIAGACLDVFATEPLPEDSPLWAMPNVILTPHIAGMRADYEALLVDIFADNVQRYRSGADLRNRVDVRRGY